LQLLGVPEGRFIIGPLLFILGPYSSYTVDQSYTICTVECRISSIDVYTICRPYIHIFAKIQGNLKLFICLNGLFKVIKNASEGYSIIITSMCTADNGTNTTFDRVAGLINRDDSNIETRPILCSHLWASILVNAAINKSMIGGASGPGELYLRAPV